LSIGVPPTSAAMLVGMAMRVISAPLGSR